MKKQASSLSSFTLYCPLILFLGLSVFSFLAAYHFHKKSSFLMDHGLITQGSLLAKETNSTKSSTLYYFKYQFPSSDGKSHAGKDMTSFASFSKAHTGDPLKIIYLETNPLINALYPVPGTKTRSILLLFLGLFLLAFSLYEYRSLHRFIVEQKHKSYRGSKPREKHRK